MLVSLLPVTTVGTFASPSEQENGGADDLFTISNQKELYEFAKRVNAGETGLNAALIADITVNRNVLKDDGTLSEGADKFLPWTPIGSNENRYVGFFDGQGHTISGLYFSDTDAAYAGLFGYIGENGRIENVGIIDSYFLGKSYVGGIVAFCMDGSIIDCRNAGTVSSKEATDPTKVGGICGILSGMKLKKAIISGCINTGSVYGGSSEEATTGGICGRNDDHGTVYKCCNAGNVSGSDLTGGIMGFNANETYGCFNTGSVSGAKRTGGIAGYAGGRSGLIAACYNTGTVTGNDEVGGIAGYAADDVIGTYNTGSVTGSSRVGGICGGYDPAYFHGNCSLTGSVTGSSDGENADIFTDGTVCETLNTAIETRTKIQIRFYRGPDKPELAFDPDTDSEGNYMIGNKSELYWFAIRVNAGETGINAVLTDDITVNENILKDNGTLSENTDKLFGWIPFGSDGSRYVGKFDGRGHTISGLYYSDETDNYVGFCRVLGGNGNITGLSIADSYFCGRTYVGGICGRNYGNITDCHTDVPINAAGFAGGICGGNNNNISNCSNTGTIVAKIPPDEDEDINTGGICGYSVRGRIIGCYNAGSISGVRQTGGVCGNNRAGKVTACYNTGSVNGTNRVGGICGTEYLDLDSISAAVYPSISGCYNIGSISGDSNVGSICGSIGSGNIYDCRFNSETSDLKATASAEGRCEISNTDGDTSAHFADGTVRDLLNNAIKDKTDVRFYQNADDSYPKLCTNHRYNDDCVCTVCGYKTTGPAITRIANGETYCMSATFMAKNCTVVKDGSTVMTPDGSGVYTLLPGTHTLTAMKDENTFVTVTVTVSRTHSADADDHDCTTPVVCKYCGTVIVQASGGHVFGNELYYDESGHWYGCRNDGCDYAEAKIAHSGTDDGDCTTPVVCVCGYVITPAKSEHSLGGEWHHDENGHWHECTNGNCDFAGTKTAHSGTDDGDCTTPVVCVCGYVITPAKQEHSLGEEWHHDENGHWRECTNEGCDFVSPKTAHGGIDDGDCTTPVICECGYVITPAKQEHTLGEEWHYDKDGHWHECTNGNCDFATSKTAHDGIDDGDCTTPVICECGYVITPAKHEHTPGDWVSDGNGNHTLGCAVEGCNVSIRAESCADGDHDHKCDLCKAKLTDHVGGIADCKNKAVCEICGERYGEINPDRHSDLAHVSAKPATDDTDGNTEYWHCEDCDRYYSDSDGENRISKADTVIPVVPKTGAEGIIILFFVLLTVAMICMTATVKRRKRS